LLFNAASLTYKNIYDNIANNGLGLGIIR